MFCHKCGTQVAEGAAFCPKCGTKLVHEDAVQHSAGTPAPSAAPQQSVAAEQTVEDTQQSPSNDSAKPSRGLLKAAGIGRVLMWGSLLLLMLHLPVSPAILVAAAAIGIILSVLGSKRPLGLTKIIELVVAVVLLVIVAASALSSGGSGDKYIQMVKGGTLSGYPQMTVGEAFDGFLANPKWESGLSDDNVRFVNVTGGILYYEKDAEIIVQFFVDEKNESFQYNACEINGIPQNNLVFWGLLETIYNGNSASGGDSTSKGLDSQGDPDFMLDKIMIGETQSYDNAFGNMEVTLDDVEFVEYLADDFYPDEECVFCRVFVTVKNIGTEAGGLPISWNKLVYDGQYEFAQYWYSEEEDLSNINPLSPPKQGTLTFMVPRIAAESDKSLILNINDGAGNAIISCIIRPGDNSAAPADGNTSTSNEPTSPADLVATFVEYGDEESWVTLYQDGTFDMQVNLYAGYGTLSGIYEETDWGFQFLVEERSFSGYEGDSVDEFEMVMCDYGMEYRGDPICPAIEGAVYSLGE